MTSKNTVKRYWRITVYTPYCGEDRTAYYAGTNEDNMHNFAQEVCDENAMEWCDEETNEMYGYDEESYMGECGYTYEEISYEEYRENCGY